MIIDQLPALATAGDNDEIAIEVGTTTYKITKSNFLKEFMPKSGGEFTGNVTINGVLDVTNRRVSATLDAPGWYRVLDISPLTSSMAQGSLGFVVEFNILKRGGNENAESHRITYRAVNNGNGGFVDESSKGAVAISAIRYTYDSNNDAHFDIRYDSLLSNGVTVYFNVYVDQPLQQRFSAIAFSAVNDSPSGETVLSACKFTQTTGERNIHANSSTSFSNAISQIQGIIGDNAISYAGAAADAIKSGISGYSNGVVNITTTGGPVYFALLGKYSVNYWAAELFTYAQPFRLFIRYYNGAYYAELYYPNY